jgi:uncharacterized membrane protein
VTNLEITVVFLVLFVLAAAISLPFLSGTKHATTLAGLDVLGLLLSAGAFHVEERVMKRRSRKATGGSRGHSTES